MEELLTYLSNYPYTDGDALRSYVRKFVEKHKGYEMHTGATRICVYHKDWDFVLKFDEAFETTHYSALEYYHYEMAAQYNVQRVLLPTAKIASLPCGLKIYRQAKYSVGWNDVKAKEWARLRKTYDQMRKSKAYGKISKGMHYDTHNYWRARATQLFGKKFMKSLQEWIAEYEINDLHTGNIGLLNGVPVLLDYAGYRGSSYTPSTDIVENY
jgi:hypothetical protein